MARRKLVDETTQAVPIVPCSNCKHAYCVDAKKMTYYCIPPDGGRSHIVSGEFQCEKGELK